MGHINVLLIDDSTIVHALLDKILAEYEDIHLQGEAYDGMEGIHLVHTLSPHIIVMDINMPKLNGLDAISQIMESKPTPIIVFSAASRDIVDLSLKAIDLGAVDILEKPATEDFSDLKDNIKRNLIPKIRSFADFKVIRRMRNSFLTSLKDEAARLEDVKARIRGNHSRLLDNQREPDRSGPADIGEVFLPENKVEDDFPVVVIGASTGGPKTLQKLFQDLDPARIRAAFVLVQHIADGFIKGFADWLQLYTAFKVKLAQKGEPLLPQVVYVASQGCHLVFSPNGTCSCSKAPPIHGIRPSASILFDSAARVFKKRLIALVLTGMGDDGSSALEVVKQEGGLVLAQDQASSLLYGMPKAALDTGFVDTVLGLADIPVFLNLYCKQKDTSLD